MERKLVFGASAIFIILVIFYAITQSRPETLNRADLNLLSTGFYVNDTFFEFQSAADDTIDFMKNSFGDYAEDSGWQDYIDKAGVCPAEKVRVVAYGNLDLIFMKQGGSEIFAAWVLSQNNKPSLKGDMLVDSNFGLGTSYTEMESYYKESLAVTVDDLEGRVFSIKSPAVSYSEPENIFADLPSPVPVSGNFGRADSVDKVKSGFLCVG